MDTDGTDQQQVLTTGTQPATRQPSDSIGRRDMAAAAFRPVLRFDTSEKWRPLDVDQFFAEGDHFLCDSTTCDVDPMSETSELNGRTGSDAYIDIDGTWFSSGDEDVYTSPNSSCTSGGLRDCDTGPASTMYYHLTQATYRGYDYIDYWWFYRANYFFNSLNFHEGDWEGVTVAPSPDDTTFDYAAFSQHGTYYAYLRDMLRCEEAPSSTVPAAGTCGTQSSPAGKRIAVMPANGSHANYTTPCSETVPSSCQQNGIGQFERGYDGSARWGRAFEDPGTTLYPMPALGSGGWSDWSGRWGKVGGSSADGPESPGNQAISVVCASIDNGPGCDDGPRSASRFASGSVIRSNSARSVSPGLVALDCDSWLGQGIAAVACDPRRLRRAVRSRDLGRAGASTMTIAGRPGAETDSAPGLVQVASTRPLSDGSRVRVEGQMTRNTRILVRFTTESRARAFLAEFRPGSLRQRLQSNRRTRGRRGPSSALLRLEIERGSLKRQAVTLGGEEAHRLRKEKPPRR